MKVDVRWKEQIRSRSGSRRDDIVSRGVRVAVRLVVVGRAQRGYGYERIEAGEQGDFAARWSSEIGARCCAR